MQLKKCGGKWVVVDRGVAKVFDTSRDAWGFVYIMRQIRENPKRIEMWKHPVKCLWPALERKRVVISVEVTIKQVLV